MGCCLERCHEGDRLSFGRSPGLRAQDPYHVRSWVPTQRVPGDHSRHTGLTPQDEAKRQPLPEEGWTWDQQQAHEAMLPSAAEDPLEWLDGEGIDPQVRLDLENLDAADEEADASLGRDAPSDLPPGPRDEGREAPSSDITCDSSASSSPSDEDNTLEEETFHGTLGHRPMRQFSAAPWRLRGRSSSTQRRGWFTGHLRKGVTRLCASSEQEPISGKKNHGAKFDWMRCSSCFTIRLLAAGPGLAT